jgi:hypothetical protein
MRKRDLHQARTFFFHPGETVTLKSTRKNKNSSARFRTRRGSKAVDASAEKLVLKMPKDGLGIQTAELDVDFAGSWQKLHLDPAGIDVLVRGSKGMRSVHHIIPGPKTARWTYRLISVKPGSTLYFCPESNCEGWMMPVTEVGEEGACTFCRSSRIIPFKPSM